MRVEVARFPVGPLLEYFATISGAALVLGVRRERVYQAKTYGLDEWTADEWACRAGFHPSEIWPDWIPQASLMTGRG